jgi:hypothetical protein
MMAAGHTAGDEGGFQPVSFDLYLWATPSPVTADQASDICSRLARGDQSATTPRPRLLEFAGELVARYPRLEDLTDPAGSPWSMSPDATPERVILSMGFSRAPEVSPDILRLASQHGLVCYDPQARQVHHPAQATPDGALRLESSDGSRAFGPSTGEIDRQVRRLTRANWYAWLEREEGTYVQAGLGSRAGAPEGKYSLEYREGSPERHFRAIVGNLDEIAAAFTGFASGEDDWKSARDWTRL